MNEGTLSVTEFAERLGVTRGAVEKYFTNGRLSGKSYYKNGRGHYRIYPEIAEAELKETENPSYKHAKETGKARPKRRTDLDKSLLEIKKETGLTKLKKEKIQIAKMVGDLVEKRKVYDALFVFGKQLRDELIAIPDGVVDDIMAAGGRAEIFQILSEAIEGALRGLSDMGQLNFDNENQG